MRKRFEAAGEEFKNSLTVACDLMILNLLTIICCIPVITAGAAVSACYSGLYRMVRGSRTGVSPAGFFRDFASLFKRATLAWLIELGCLALLAGDFWFAVVYSQPRNTFFMVFAIVLAVLVLFVAVWLFPLIARFENRLGVHIKNSLLMALARFPRTLAALAVQAAFLAVPILVFDAFIFAGWFWLLLGASLPLYITAKLLGSELKCEPLKADADAQK